MPKPKPNETREDYVARCVPIVLNEGTAKDSDQAVAVCNSMWQMARKNATPHDRLLELVRMRTTKQSEFNYGILTADRYVKRFLDEIGVQGCYRHMCQTSGDWASFDDVMTKAAGTLSYINPAMEVKAKGDDELPTTIERPKNSLMVFRHVLTTSTKDRDGDILRTKGAKPDPKMLLLWQHVHTLPIGKMLAIASHTKDELQLYSCIVDMNDLCHDAAVMVDNGMGRFSHGFRALDFLEIKEGRGSVSGFDVKEFEVLEESIVSVPANADAKTEEVLLSLVEGGKLTSPLMKDFGRAIRGRQPLSVPVMLDMKVLVNGQETKSHENERREKAGIGGEAGNGSPEEAPAVSDEGRGEEKSAEAGEVISLKQKQEQEQETLEQDCGRKDKNMVCPDCDHVGPDKESKCPKCKAKLIPRKDFVLEKLGRVLSKANEEKIRDAMDDLDEAGKMDGLPRGCKALINQARRSLGEVVTAFGDNEGVEKAEPKMDAKQAMAVLLATGGEKELRVMSSMLKAIEEGCRDDEVVKQYAELFD